VQPYRDHDLLDPERVTAVRYARTAALGDERRQSAAHVRGLPAKEASPAAYGTGQRCLDALLAQRAHEPRPVTHDRELTRTLRPRGWSATPRREEAKARTFLERVPEPAALRIAELVSVVRPNVIHGADDGGTNRSVPEIRGNLI
jgi:hypothetical protein